MKILNLSRNCRATVAVCRARLSGCSTPQMTHQNYPRTIPHLSRTVAGSNKTSNGHLAKTIPELSRICRDLSRTVAVTSL